MNKVKLLVEGPALTRSGYGVHTRLVLESLREREDLFDIYVNPLRWGATGWLLDNDEFLKWVHEKVQKFQSLGENGNFDVHVHVGIPNEFQRKAPYAICVTAGIEATKVDPSWIQKSYEMDKIVVPSNFSKWVFENTFYDGQNKETKQQMRVGCGAPVEVVSYPVREYKNNSIDLDLKDDFNFITVAQWGVRKNLDNTIRWFLSEFKDEEVGLVVKTNFAKNSTPDREECKKKIDLLVKQSGKDTKCSVYLLHGEMTDEEIDAIYKNDKIKAILSTTHGEGFGLPLFEAAYNALPVVAPGWSGHMDFLYGPVKDKKTKKVKNKPLFAKVDYSLKQIQKEAVWNNILVKDAMWCYVNEKDFKNKIRKVYSNYGMYKSWAESLASHLRETVSLDAVLNKMLKTLIPEKWLIKPEYFFVSDLFVEDYVGGAELSLETLIKTCPSNKVAKVRSAEVSERLIDSNKEAKWVIGNIANLSNEMISHISNSGVSYTFVEFDYKYCKHRNPELYKMVEGTTCDYKNTEKGQIMTEFVNNASSVFFMSENQMNLHKENLPNINNKNMHVLSSLFDGEFFNFISNVKEKNKIKNDKWVVLGSRSWVKGLNETEAHCKDKGYDYEVLWNLPYGQFLEKLAESKGLCFKPSGLDTCPRMVIEAKLLGCELDLNDLVQHSNESWFKGSYDDIVSYLKDRPSFFWKKSFE